MSMLPLATNNSSSNSEILTKVIGIALKTSDLLTTINNSRKTLRFLDEMNAEVLVEALNSFFVENVEKEEKDKPRNLVITTALALLSALTLRLPTTSSVFSDAYSKRLSTSPHGKEMIKTAFCHAKQKSIPKIFSVVVDVVREGGYWNLLKVSVKGLFQGLRVGGSDADADSEMIIEAFSRLMSSFCSVAEEKTAITEYVLSKTLESTTTTCVKKRICLYILDELTGSDTTEKIIERLMSGWKEAGKVRMAHELLTHHIHFRKNANYIVGPFGFYVRLGMRLYEQYLNESNTMSIEERFVFRAVLDIVEEFKGEVGGHENEVEVLSGVVVVGTGDAQKRDRFEYVSDCIIGKNKLPNFRPARLLHVGEMATATTTLVRRKKKKPKLSDPVATLIRQGSLLIFECLSFQRIKNMRLVCSNWASFLGRGNAELWKRVYEIKGLQSIIHSPDICYYDEFKKCIRRKTKGGGVNGIAARKRKRRS